MQRFKIPPIENPKFITNLEVRISDINYGNHLGNDSLVSLLHEARIRFFKEYNLSEINADGIGVLVTTLVVNYKGQAFHGDSLEIKIAAEQSSATSIDLMYELTKKHNQKEVARAINTVTFYDYNLKKVVKIPDEFFALTH